MLHLLLKSIFACYPTFPAQLPAARMLGKGVQPSSSIAATSLDLTSTLRTSSTGTQWRVMPPFPVFWPFST